MIKKNEKLTELEQKTWQGLVCFSAIFATMLTVFMAVTKLMELIRK